MDWYWNVGALLLGLFVIVLIMVACAVVVIAFADDFTSTRTFLIAWVTLSLLVIIGANMVVSKHISMTSPPTNPTAATASSELGLESDKPYPVQLGRVVDGSTGSAYAYGGVFSSRAGVNLQPGSAVSMNFQVGDNSYLLQIPVTKVTFRQTEGPSQVTFTIAGSAIGYGTMESDRCETVFAVPWVMKRCTDYRFMMNSVTERRGLAPIVANNLDSALIELSPELYQQVLGTP